MLRAHVGETELHCRSSLEHGIDSAITCKEESEYRMLAQMRKQVQLAMAQLRAQMLVSRGGHTLDISHTKVPQSNLSDGSFAEDST